MARNNTKRSGKSPGTGETKAALIKKAQKLLERTNSENKIVGNIQVEIPVGKSPFFVAKAYVPMKAVIYQKHTEATLASFLTSFMDDAYKIYASIPSKGGTNAPGVADKPLISEVRGKGTMIGKRVKLILPERYPTNEIGGNLGTVDGGESKRKGRSYITMRVPPVVPLLSVGLLLYAMNENAPNADRKIGEYTGDSGNVIYLTPSTPDEKNIYEAGLANMQEVTA